MFFPHRGQAVGHDGRGEAKIPQTIKLYTFLFFHLTMCIFGAHNYLSPMKLKKALTFLLIDDDDDDRELFQIALEEVENEVHFIGAASGIEALKILQSNTEAPDYIFLDLNMPHMSGRECLIELKKNPHLTSIPVIIFSTSNDPRDIEETRALGAIGFITKPEKTSKLTCVLNDFIVNQLHLIND